MDLALGVAVGSSMQIALLVTPLMVIIGWGMQIQMSLLFNVFETAVMLISVVMVNYLMMVNMRKLDAGRTTQLTMRVTIGWQEQLA